MLVYGFIAAELVSFYIVVHNLQGLAMIISVFQFLSLSHYR